MKYSASMFSTMCVTDRCRNPLETTRHHSPPATSIGTSSEPLKMLDPRKSDSEPACAATARNTSTFRPMSAYVIRGCAPCFAPAMVRATATRAAGRDSATQARQWKPTDAGVRQEGHAGRPHREQRRFVGRSGCQVHTIGGMPPVCGP